MSELILTLNAGSSSIKFAVYAVDGDRLKQTRDQALRLPRSVWLGIAIDPEANAEGALCISPEGRQPSVWVILLGIADAHSIAYGCARAFRTLGADLAVTYLNEKAKPFVEPCAQAVEAGLFLPCDVTQEGQLEGVFETIRERWGRLDFALHSIAFAPREDLQGRLVDSSSHGFGVAVDVSAHSFLRMSRLAEPLMTDGGSLFAMTFYGSERVVNARSTRDDRRRRCGHGHAGDPHRRDADGPDHLRGRRLPHQGLRSRSGLRSGVDVVTGSTPRNALIQRGRNQPGHHRSGRRERRAALLLGRTKGKEPDAVSGRAGRRRDHREAPFGSRQRSVRRGQPGLQLEPSPVLVETETLRKIA